jgi:cellobiose phosphorylase
MDTAQSAGPNGPDPAREAVNRYGRFSPDGSEYWITDPRTPRPWVNVIANPRLGLVVSQTGSGFTWIDNSQLAVITRWQQDLVQDSSGKFLYLRDAASGEAWSLSPAPMWPVLDLYRCRHGLGYTTFETVHRGIAAQWTLFVHASDPVEFWRVELRNLDDRPRSLELTGFLEWNMGMAPSPRREFGKLFLETWFDRERGAVFARNHMWEVPSSRWGHWNTEFPYVAALACTESLLAVQGDRGEFLGRCGDLRAPAALGEEEWRPRFGRHDDPVAALRAPVHLAPGELRQVGFVLAVGTSHTAACDLLAGVTAVEAVDRALDEARAAWRERLAAHRVATTEPTLDFLTNDWLRYQAIAARIWGRCGYYQQSGAYGFRDQLQDSQVWLTIEPEHCREQINLHAAHQFADGSVYHWWHPLSEQGHVTRTTDDLLWLAFVTAAYIRETGRFDVLEDATPFLDDPQPQPLREHVARAFDRVFKRTSPRGLPYIGAGDWNDGLSAVGLEEHGESIWLAEFLAGLVADWAEIHRRVGEASRASDLAACRELLVGAINQHGWDGEWYLRATRDDGSPLGSRANRFGRIFLNAQVWAVLHDVAPPERAASCMAAVRKHLVSEAGALLLAPAWVEPAREIGYITRYAPGLRENGGVYTHAATWAIAAACKVRDAELVGALLAAINPALKDPDRYLAEPYVLPGNVDGPDSPHHGRGGWTWYTGSAAWLHRVVTHWVLGVRPEWDGLRIDPCLPPGWPGARMTRPWRGATYRISIERSDALPDGVRTEVTLDGARLDGTLLPEPAAPGEQHDVWVRCR